MRANQIRAWAKIRNSAAHGKPEEFNEGDVNRIIVGVRDFVAVQLSKRLRRSQLPELFLSHSLFFIPNAAIRILHWQRLQGRLRYDPTRYRAHYGRRRADGLR